MVTRANIEFLKAPPIYRQIVSHYEGLIYSGKLQPGTRIPSTLELAKQFRVGRNAVQQALSILSSRGLVDRHSKRGTFVSNRVNSKTIGVIFGANIVIQPEMYYLRLFCNEIIRQARKKGWKIMTYYPVDMDSYAEFMADVRQDVDEGRLNGIISMDASENILSFLDHECQAPSIIGAFQKVEYSLSEEIPYRGITYLLERGFVRIAVISHESSRGPINKQLSSCIDAAFKDRNLPNTAIIYAGVCANERGGIEMAEKVLAASETLPEGILSLNDIASRGIIFTLMNRGIRIPDDIGIISHANKGHDILCPVPLTRLEMDPADHAEQALERFFAKLEGRKPATIDAKAKLIIGQSCGEDYVEN